MNGAAEHLDANAAAAGLAGVLAELEALVDAGEELVERDARRNFGTRTAADGKALAGGERGVLGRIAVVLDVAGKVVGICGAEAAVVAPHISPGSPSSKQCAPLTLADFSSAALA